MGFARAWRSSIKFRVGVGITGALIALGLVHRLLVHVVIGDTDPLATGSFAIFLNPGREHLLGTDRFGRDVLALVLVGLPNSLIVAGIAGLLATVIGIAVGFTAGYKGRRTDATLRTLTDMFLVIPTLPLIIILAAYVQQVSVPQIALILAAFSWPYAARVIRAQVLSLRERPYIELAKITNMTDREIIVGDILPNMLPFIGIGFAASALGAAFALVGLEVIGLSPGGGNTMDLGLLINFAQQWGVLSLGKGAILAAPVALLVLLFFGIALINQGLEELYNPRLRGAA
jgi:peptide/nickel transport system permease protein